MSELRDLIEFVRQENLRLDRRMAERERADIRRHEEYMANFAKLREDTQELRDESRAQLQALLRVIDRLDSGGGATTA